MLLLRKIDTTLSELKIFYFMNCRNYRVILPDIQGISARISTAPGRPNRIILRAIPRTNQVPVWAFLLGNGPVESLGQSC